MKICCGDCKFEEDSYCTLKNARIKKSKRRFCKYYIPNEEKIESKEKVKSPIMKTKRPDWFWKEKSEIKKLMKEREEREKTKEEVYAKHKQFDPKDYYVSTAE